VLAALYGAQALTTNLELDLSVLAMRGATGTMSRWAPPRGPQRTQWARQLRGSTCTTSLRPHETQ
jgi:hypothetical protein